MSPSPGNAITITVLAPRADSASGELAAIIAEAGGRVTGLHHVDTEDQAATLELTYDTINEQHAHEIHSIVESLEGFTVVKADDKTFAAHQQGKIQVTPKALIKNRTELSQAYSPGVSRVCLAIAENKDLARTLTVKGNTIAVVTDGSAILGLGNLGPEAALPVMEGKAALFKQFADVDAWPVCLDTQDTEEIIQIVKALAPVYGGINLEDIAAPRCFEIEERLKDELDIPVFHDDQHGTAIVTLAALTNALKVADKKLSEARIVVSGVGAAGSAIIQLLLARGAQHIIAAGRSGAIHSGQEYENHHLTWIAEHTNELGFSGSLKEALVGADVFIGVSGPNLFGEAEVATMEEDAIVFALANPTPEVDPDAAACHALIVATGRSDLPNQINNILAFPGFFRGLLDAGVSKITTPMLLAAVDAIADCIPDGELHPTNIIPTAFDPRVSPAVASAVAAAADK